MKDELLLSRHNFLPSVGKTELDEMMTEESGAVRETHNARRIENRMLVSCGRADGESML
jgi:hypothetical protein